MKWALKCGRENTEHRIVFLTRSRSFPVQPAKKQQQREESGLASLFLMALFLNSLSELIGKLFWMLFLTVPFHMKTHVAFTTFFRLFRKSTLKTPKQIHSFYCCVLLATISQKIRLSCYWKAK